MDYKCPRCGYNTRYLSHIVDHFKRKRPCKLAADGVLLTDEIKELVITNSYRPHNPSINNSSQQIINIEKSEVNQITTNNNKTEIHNNIIVQYIIDGKLNSIDVIQKLENHVIDQKYGSDILNGRLDDLRYDIVENGYTFADNDLMIMTNKLTECLDHKNLTDAYYSYDSKTFTYCIRCDEDSSNNTQKWFWKLCTEKHILNHILMQMKELVFDDYDTQLSRQFVNDHDDQEIRHKITEFYKILRYFMIKPKCCSARHDNEILFYTADDEYRDHTVGFDLCDTLQKMYIEVPIDVEDLFKTRDSVLEIIQTNAKSAWSIIKDKVIESINLDRNLITTR